MNKKTFFILLPIFIVQTLLSQPRQILRRDGKMLANTAIDSIVKKLMDTAGVPGLSIGIVNNNRVDYIKSYGYKNKATNQWNDSATCFYAASLSKSVFAYLVMQLVDKEVVILTHLFLNIYPSL